MSQTEYTYDRYCDFLESLITDGRRFRAYDQSLTAGDVLLRHDVDLSPAKALEMARTEADLGVHATYFFLCSTPLYNPLTGRHRDVIQRIESLGHDVGLHFSTHQYWDSDECPSDEEIARRVEAERDIIDTVAADPIATVSFHAPPEWILERTIDGVESTYEPRFFSDIGYCADSSGRWREDPPTPAAFDDRMQVLTHPGLWGNEDVPFEGRVLETATNSANRVHTYSSRRYLHDQPPEDTVSPSP